MSSAWRSCWGRRASCCDARSGSSGRRAQHLSERQAVSIHRRDDNLTRSVGPVRGCRGCRATRGYLPVQGIDVIDIRVTEPIVGTEVGAAHIARAVAQHHTDAVALDKSPFRCIFPENTEAKHVAEIAGGRVEVRDREQECPRGDGWLHCGLPHWSGVSVACDPASLFMLTVWRGRIETSIIGGSRRAPDEVPRRARDRSYRA